MNVKRRRLGNQLVKSVTEEVWMLRYVETVVYVL